MKAVGYKEPGVIDRDDALVDITLAEPKAEGRDILVEVKAVSVNPVDTKVRTRAGAEGDGWKVLGWDAAGIVRAVGSDVTGFKAGDEVWYAGSIARQGTNSELHLVDERIVSKKPASLSFTEAAAMPLTGITAWEMLFDRLDVTKPVAGAADTILVIGGAGGVGSMTIQILRALTDLTIIATASRPETIAWVKELGAHHVINHREPLARQVADLGMSAPAFVFSTTGTGGHLSDIAELIAPQGRFGLIDDPESLDVSPFKQKSVSTHWELMFTRSLFETADMAEQGKLLAEIAQLVEEKKIRSTLTETIGTINAANLKKGHSLIESGTAKGKIVLSGF